MPATDFDFLPGRWKVANRKLTNTLDPGCDDWREFPAISEAQAILGGGGNMDQFLTEGYTGYSLRLYDPATDAWRIWWSSTDRPGRLDPPVEGRFDAAGDGLFECDDVLEGVPILVRFTWTGIAAGSPRWDQSFSFDGGTTWKLNWIMDFTPAG
jgi:hypothetical protein